MSRLRARFEESSGARNLIQNPELVRSVRDALGLRQEHITPTLNEGMQAVLIAGDLTKSESAVVSPVMAGVNTQTSGAATQQLFALCNPRGNPPSASASAVRISNVQMELWMPGGTAAQTWEFYLQKRANLDQDWGAAPRSALQTTYVDSRKFPVSTLNQFGSPNTTNTDVQYIQNPGDLGTPSLAAFLYRTQAFAITIVPRIITFPGLILDPGWVLTWRDPTAAIVVPNGLNGMIAWQEELIQ